MSEEKFVHLFLLLLHAVVRSPVGSEDGPIAGRHLMGLFLRQFDVEGALMSVGQIDGVVLLPGAGLFFGFVPFFDFTVGLVGVAVRSVGVFLPFFLCLLFAHLQCGSFSSCNFWVDVAVFLGLASGRPTEAILGAGIAGARAAFVSFLVPRHGGFHKEFLVALGRSGSFFHNTKT